ncbi:hypothetical protein SBRV1_gp57 [Sulfolobales Beppu rod-shaped virus 1]|uniref:Uncharacterized protein n=1 Tax=Sulfolobales Beppu rod-shaped virus 1 TaxID=2493121 RepID=A0A3Q8Q3X5_9VIRU|nr:hypothetical protein QIT32_gp04 [Sulfolobales Beppu rod-shaped virus 1]YP_010771897.1 hypothetical protein QIT32_gp57 [Sulfolobales Beppu rod-shaped virus 1]AZI75893.1 hypothetical protein SBRV1_gp04 [Sulfolobales Beppu rod-shaped virus 1]AZI75946.1 hypothetical protein SBRV1_gp57 [Sulfolobales Beppu rod-shaped virus 1]
MLYYNISILVYFSLGDMHRHAYFIFFQAFLLLEFKSFR